MPPRVWRCGGFELSLERPLLMGIVNVTPDSFSDGGKFVAADEALSQAQRLLEEGADIIDVGAESTRPGALGVDAEEELRRVRPVLAGLVGCGKPVSIDTHKPIVMRAALELGASIVNDVRALRDEGALQVVAESNCGVVLMHMRGTPADMQFAPEYADVVGEVAAFLTERRDAALAAGISAERIAVDPGFGFGKRLRDNMALLRELGILRRLGTVLAGVSRKSMLKNLTGRQFGARLGATVAASIAAAARGAEVLRVHDVGEIRDALTVWRAVNEAQL
jgi:dihydropteroate synthase